MRADAPYYSEFEIVGNADQFQDLENCLVSLEFADRRLVVVEDILGTFVESFPLVISLWKI